MSQIFNSLIFDDIAIQLAYKNLIAEWVKKEPIVSVFDEEISVVDADDDIESEPDLPAIFVTVFQNGIRNADSLEKQNYSTFTVELEIYTSGKNKATKNKNLCNAMIALLQSAGYIDNVYFSEGLTFESNNEVGSGLEDVYRRVVRMSGQCDNLTKHIK